MYFMVHASQTVKTNKHSYAMFFTGGSCRWSVTKGFAARSFARSLARSFVCLFVGWLVGWLVGWFVRHLPSFRSLRRSFRRSFFTVCVCFDWLFYLFLPCSFHSIFIFRSSSRIVCCSLGCLPNDTTSRLTTTTQQQQHQTKM